MKQLLLPSFNPLRQLWQGWRRSHLCGQFLVDVLHMAQHKDRLQAPQPGPTNHVQFDEAARRSLDAQGKIAIERLQQLLTTMLHGSDGVMVCPLTRHLNQQQHLR